MPSEAEWEYSCRAKTTTPFYFGETITAELVNHNSNYPYANVAKNSSGYRQVTTDVGSYPPNEWGLYDMHAAIPNSKFNGSETLTAKGVYDS